MSGPVPQQPAQQEPAQQQPGPQQPAEDSIFAAIRAAHGDRPWGEVLDAGTGRHSLRWLSGLPTTRWVAVTGDGPTAADLRSLARAGQGGHGDEVVVGNWQDPSFLEGRQFDVILADYLLGALDAYAPYYQDRLFARLRLHLRPGGRLYAVGLEPSPVHGDGAWAALVLETERLRDACIRLCGDRCYREYPATWVARSLTAAGYQVRDTRRFPIRYGASWIESQLDVGRKKLPRVEAALRAPLEAALERLLARARALEADGQRSTFCEDYLVVAE